MDNSSDKVEQWLQDESFINWAFHKDDMDTAKWEGHFNTFPEERKQAEEARAMLNHIVQNVDIPKEKSMAALTSLHQRLDKIEVQPKDQTVTNERKLPSMALKWWVAATVAIAVSFVFLLVSTSSRDRIVSTHFGERLPLVLPDGSEVVLNANSKIRYSEDQPREIWLEGEAYFNVKKGSLGERFRVHTDDLRIEVLGTTFNVNSRRKRTKVFLEEGRINLNLKDSASSKLTLEPGDQVTYSALGGNPYQRIQKPVEPLTYWKNGVIEMKDTKLEEVLFRIEEVYGVRVKLAKEELRLRKVNLVIPIEELEMAFKQLEYALGLEIRQGKDQMYYLE